MKQEQIDLAKKALVDDELEFVAGLTRDELVKLERQLIPVLNTVQRLLGKKPKRAPIRNP